MVVIGQDEIVQDDLLLVICGEQIFVDGFVWVIVGLEVDEFQIIGEVDLVIKGLGDELVFGSVIFGGYGIVQVMQVGYGSFIKQMV